MSQTPDVDAPAPTVEERILDLGERIVVRLDAVDEGVQGLTTSQTNLAIAQRRSRKWVYGLAIVAALCVAAAFVAGLGLVRLTSTNRCLVVVASAVSDRTGALAPANAKRQAAQTARDKAQAKVFADVFPLDGQQPATKAQIIADGAALRAAQGRFDAADAAYQDVYQAHPPPPAPNRAC